jgi:hypothetical protein
MLFALVEESVPPVLVAILQAGIGRCSFVFAAYSIYLQTTAHLIVSLMSLHQNLPADFLCLALPVVDKHIFHKMIL